MVSTGGQFLHIAPSRTHVTYTVYIAQALCQRTLLTQVQTADEAALYLHHSWSVSGRSAEQRGYVRDAP